jgi:hypothetical protein
VWGRDAPAAAAQSAPVFRFIDRQGEEKMKRILVVLIVLLLAISAACDSPRQISRLGGFQIGLERQFFTDLASMKVQRPALPFDAKAKETIERIDSLIANNAWLYTEEGEELFSDLVPYRETAQVQESIHRWADIQASRQKRNYQEIITKLNDDNPNALRDYAAEHGIEIPLPDYPVFAANVLQAYPFSVDARNNLALFFMVNGIKVRKGKMSVMSQMELETIQLMTDGKYYPAIINLVVALEMNGQQDEAKELAYSALEKWSDIPQVRYNAAWYKFYDQDYAQAKELLKPLVDVELELVENDKGRKVEPENFYEDLYNVIEAVEYENKPFWELGIAEKYLYSWDLFELFDFAIPHVTLVYLVGLLILGAIFYRLLDFNGFLTLVIILLLEAYWISWWGIPDGWNWIWFLLNPMFALILGAMTASETWDS